MSDLIPKHGGYRNLKSFQVSQLVYDVTVRFVESYIDRFSRTKDQMVQAARSGVQNIAEGSQASATSKKTELKLTQVARASLEELKLDYEDFLRQRGLPMLEPRHPALVRFKERKCRTLEEVKAWVVDERGKNTDRHGHTDGQGPTRTNTDTRTGMDGEVSRTGVAGRDAKTVVGISRRGEGPSFVNPRGRGAGNNNQPSVTVSESPCPSVCPCSSLSSACLAANTALSLLNLACYLLDRQVERLATDFENEGGFTERLYRVRNAKRREHR